MVLIALYSIPSIIITKLFFFPSGLPFPISFFYTPYYHSLFLYNFCHYNTCLISFVFVHCTFLQLSILSLSYTEVNCALTLTSLCYSSDIATIICSARRLRLRSMEGYIPRRGLVPTSSTASKGTELKKSVEQRSSDKYM